MAITDSRSVLILGAGASVPFGLPLGGALIDLVYDLIAHELNFTDGDGRGRRAAARDSSITKAHGSSQLMRNTLRLYILEISKSNPLASSYHSLNKPMIELAALLDNQTSQTIDDFIAVNPGVSALTKIGIASVFFHHLYRYDEEQDWWSLKPLSQRYLDFGKKTARRRNWVHHLINLVRHENFPVSTTEIKRVRIINFNYDGILEHVLDHQFNNTGETFDPWQNYIEIVHTHGFMGDLKPTVYAPETEIEAWAKAINVVKEPKPTPEVKAARTTAKTWVSESYDVYMAGFALSASNAEMLGWDDLGNQEQDWHVANYDGSPGLRRTVENYVRRSIPGNSKGRYNTLEGDGLIRHFPEAGTNTEPLHIDTWFEIGVPGQLL